MSDELVSFKMLIASDAASERDLLLECAAKAKFPVDHAGIPDPTDPSAIRKAVAEANLDFVFVDSRIATADRRAIYGAVLSSKTKPLVIFIGPADLAAREVAPASAAADGVLVKPFGAPEAGAMIDVCARARLAKQVLVVDDSTTVRAVAHKVLQASRFRLEIAEAANGNSAVEQAGQRHLDVVLLDCSMPGLDGFGTVDLLKRARHDLQVVMMLDKRDARLEDRARASGADAWLCKPFYVKDVDTVLRRLFGLVATKAG